MIPWILLGLIVYGIYKAPDRQAIINEIMAADESLFSNPTAVANMSTAQSTQQQTVQPTTTQTVVNTLANLVNPKQTTVLKGFGIQHTGMPVPIDSPFKRRNYAYDFGRATKRR
jgi:hypothetical protein